MQAILNTIYIHEVLKIKTVKDIYLHFDASLLNEINAGDLAKAKYMIPKYAIKLLTGGGKTWIMNALLIWQYLNAKHEEAKSGLFTKNFLLVAPGLIVYERLLDAYLGKENEAGNRVFETSDFYKYQELFTPPAYKDEVFGFIQNNVVKKEEIGKRITGDGVIAITNWHLFMSAEEEEADDASPLDDPSKVVADLFPLRPGTSAGNDLSVLDNKYLRGSEIEYLAELPDLMTVNDEAHHIHENKNFGEIEEVEWQKGLNYIAEKKGNSFIQIDFSATPYDVAGTGNNRTKHYFPHIVANYDLATGIKKGIVKIITIDRRKEITDLPLDFNAVRDDKNNVIGLSDGQKLMLRAGIRKLRILEENFTRFASNKHPKMMVICEDTNVSPFVEQFLVNDGTAPDEIIRVDSNRKGEIRLADWKTEKQKLFNIDQYESPKVIISVMMLREGFDVSNICVIVPLRSSTAPILLEQTIGRGLRLMWREPEYTEIKQENRKRLLEQKKEPDNYLDLLSIIEHPRFIDFYNDLMAEGAVGETGEDPNTRDRVLGDLIKVGLKENYQEYELFWPIIRKEQEEEIRTEEITSKDLKPFTAFDFPQLKRIVGEDGESFISNELLVKTQFGEYKVTANLFTAQSYNEYLQKIIRIITTRIDKVGERKTKEFPTLQINQPQILRVIDEYIKRHLFGETFNPFEDGNWRVLLAKNGIVTDHIIREVGKLIYDMQTAVDVTEAQVDLVPFSTVEELTMRERYSLPVVKTVYERLSFPSNKGQFERDFMVHTDNDGTVDAFTKIYEYQHGFASIPYIRTDGLLSIYHPDFVVKSKDRVFIVETKGNDKINDDNVKQKQLAILAWVKRVNQLEHEHRMGCIWEYILLSDNHFYGLRENGANAVEILERARINEAQVTGKLFV
ncbi:MAG: restriction endonuclease subunit R [Pedobacter sp.]|nr:MAG: restriction endonuclease subunit R [Pedobacter sp.]